MPSSKQTVDSEQHYFLHTLDSHLCVESKSMWEDEWTHKITIASKQPKHQDVEWEFGFPQYEYESVLRLTPKHFEIFVFKLP